MHMLLCNPVTQNVTIVNDGLKLWPYSSYAYQQNHGRQVSQESHKKKGSWENDDS